MEFERENPPMTTFDEVSMERSKSFVMALQELKILRPQLYSAAAYCEKSYLHSEQKQMVLDNLKDYAVRALVNAVDHLGTVAYKLSDLLEQQTSDISTVEIKISCLKQQLLTCQIYMDKEGLRQQQLLALIPRHHKHYSLPNSVSKKVHFSPHIQTDARQGHIPRRPRPAVSKTLSWHLASETKSTLKSSRQLGNLHAVSCSSEDPKTSEKPSGVFDLADAEESSRMKSSTARHHLSSGGYASTAVLHPSSAAQRESSEGTKALAAFRSFDNPRERAIVRAPVRSKSVLSAFFVKQKTPKLNTVS
ncbi:hypothetical protein NMG60_11028970 [Bertholletia excelsa]